MIFLRKVTDDGDSYPKISDLQASILVETPFPELGEAETEQITSVIFGLLRQNSFTFLEVLENARWDQVQQIRQPSFKIIPKPV